MAIEKLKQNIVLEVGFFSHKNLKEMAMALVKGIGKTGSTNWKGREQTAVQAWKGGDVTCSGRTLDKLEHRR